MVTWCDTLEELLLDAIRASGREFGTRKVGILWRERYVSMDRRERNGWVE